MELLLRYILEVLRQFERIIIKDKNAKILVLFTRRFKSHPKRVLSAGAIGYLTKGGCRRVD